MGNTENADQKQEIMTGKEYRSIFWRSFTIQSSWSFDKMMAYGYMYAIEKPLRKIYPNDDDYYAALKRHTETFNITPHVSPFLMGLGVAMEEQNAKSEDFDAESVNNVKVGLMDRYPESVFLFLGNFQSDCSRESESVSRRAEVSWERWFTSLFIRLFILLQRFLPVNMDIS